MPTNAQDTAATAVSLEQKIIRYNQLKDAIAALEAEKKEISSSFKTGLESFGIQQIQIPVEDEFWQLKLTQRLSRSVAWDVFKRQHPELYTQFVTESSSEYVDIRRVNAPASQRCNVVVAPVTQPVGTSTERQAAE